MINLYLFIYILINSLLKKLNCNSIKKEDTLIINEDSEDILDFTYEYQNELNGQFYILCKKQYKYMSILITFPEDYSKLEYNLKNSLSGELFSYGSILVPYGYYSKKNISFNFYCDYGCNYSLEFRFGDQGYMRQYILKNIIKMIPEFNKTLDFIFIPNEKEDHNNYLATISTTNIDDINMTIIGDNEKIYETRRSELFYSYYSSISNSKNYSFLIKNSNIDNIILTIFDRKLNINQKLFKIDYLLYHYADSDGNQSCNSIEGINERWQIRALSDYPLEIYFDTEKESKKYTSSNNFMTVIQEEMDDQSKICLNKKDQDSIIILQFLNVSSNEYSHNFLDPLFINVTNPDYLDSNGVKFYSFVPYDFKYYYNYSFIIKNTSGLINVYSYNCKTYPNCNFSASDIQSFIEKKEIIKLEYNSIENYFKYSENQHDFSKDNIILIHCDDPNSCEYNIKLIEEINAITSGELYILNQTDQFIEYAFIGNSESDYFYLQANGNKNYLTIFVNPSEYEDVNLYYIIYDENDKDNKLKGVVGFEGNIFLPLNFYNNKILKIEFYSSILLQVQFIFYFDDKIYFKNFVFIQVKLIEYFNKSLQISYLGTENFFMVVKSLKNQQLSIKINDQNLDYNSKFNFYFLDKYTTGDTYTIDVNFETDDYICMSIIPISSLLIIGSQLFNINFNYIKYIEPNIPNIITFSLDEINTKYEISIVTNETIKIQLPDIEHYIKPNYKYIFPLSLNQNFIKVDTDNYSVFQIQLINGTKKDNYNYLLTSLLLNTTNMDILNDNEVRFYTIDYLNSSFYDSNKYIFKVNTIEGSVSAYIHKCISYPYCIYNSSYIQQLIDKKDKNLLIFNKNNDTNLYYEIENIENINIENILIIQCGNTECKINIYIENNYVKKNKKKGGITIMIIFILLCYIFVILIIILLIRRYKNKNKDYSNLIEQVIPSKK